MKRIHLISLIILVIAVLTGCNPADSPAHLETGSAAPLFTLDDALGGKTSLSDYQGTPVLLYFHMAVG